MKLQKNTKIVYKPNLVTLKYDNIKYNKYYVLIYSRISDVRLRYNNEFRI